MSARNAHAYDADWRRVRTAVLTRDGRRCRVQIPGVCTTIATTVDHIVSLVRGGARLDPANLRAACRPCNSHLGALEGNARRRADRHRPHPWFLSAADQHPAAVFPLSPGPGDPGLSSP